MRTPDHEGLMYTSFMPRWFAHWYNNLRHGEPYQTYTHTKAGYERLLREAGFSSSKFYLPYPGYNLPQIILPYGDLRALAFMIDRFLPKSGALVETLIRFAARIPLVPRLWRYFFFSFNIVASV
jgi:hypothetical protein